MRAASRTALGQVHAYWEQQSSQVEDLLTISGQLFDIAELLEGSDRLTRVITDPAREPEAKEALLRNLFTDKVAPIAVDLLVNMAGMRWSQASDFIDALLELAVLVALTDAQREGHLERVEDESFRLATVLSKQSELRQFISNREIEEEAREKVFLNLVGDQVTKQLSFVAAQAVRRVTPKRPVVAFIRRVARVANDMRNSMVASVTCAIHPSQAQIERLERIIQARFQKPVAVHVTVDQTLLGGMRILVGGSVLDGSLLTKLEEVRRQIKH